MTTTQIHVPFLDVKGAYLELKEEIDEAVARVVNSGRYILGPEVEAFEREYANYCQAKHCFGVASGLDALMLSLKALEIGPGDEVLVPSMTFVATWMAVSNIGSVPVAVEPQASTCNLDPSLLEAKITEKTKAIIAVHLFGNPADMPAICKIARRHNLFVIEDAAQAHGATINGEPVGKMADATAWSFYPGKNLGALGDGGAITLKDDALAEKVKLLRNYGSVRKYCHETLGYNSRLDPLQAAVLSVKLKHLNSWNNRRATLAGIYSQRLLECGITLPHIPLQNKSSWHLYAIRVNKRDDIMERMRVGGVDTQIHYPSPPSREKPYQALNHETPIADEMASTLLSLPIGPTQDVSATEFVVETLLKNL
jgi:dTDP-4-amino-4,6-dideoxygalactose transaminase